MPANATFVADLVANLGDGTISVPGLKFVALTVKQIIEVAEKVKDNKEKVKELSDRTAHLVGAMIEGMKGRTEDEVDDRLKEDLRRFGAELEGIRKDAEKLASRSRVKRVLKRADDAEKLAKWDRCLTNALHTFTIYNFLAIRLDCKV